VSRSFLQPILFAIAIAVIVNFSSCEEEFNEFEFANDIVVFGNLMFDEDSALANQIVVLAIDYVRRPNVDDQFVDFVNLDSDTTDENGFFSFTYKTNNKVVGADTCGEEFAEGLHMRAGNEILFSCFPSNRNISDLQIYTTQEMNLTLTINLGNVDQDTVFFNYAPLDTLHPNYIERIDANGRRHVLFYAIASPTKTIIASYTARLKNGQYEGLSEQKRGIEAIRYGIGFNAYEEAQTKTWRPEGKPFTDQLEISIN